MSIPITKEEALKVDKQELRKLYKVFKAIEYPKMQTDEGIHFIDDVKSAIGVFLESFAREAGKL